MKRCIPAATTAVVLLLALGCEPPEVIPRHEPPVPAPGAPPASEAGAGGELLAEADALGEQLERKRPPVGIIIKLGRMYQEAGRYPDAIDWYRRAIEEAEPALRAFEGLAAEEAEVKVEPGLQRQARGGQQKGSTKGAMVGGRGETALPPQEERDSAPDRCLGESTEFRVPRYPDGRYETHPEALHPRQGIGEAQAGEAGRASDGPPDPKVEPPEGCLPEGPGGSFESASARAAVISREGDRAAALACYRAALVPVAEALRRRAESWRAIDSPVRAFEDLRLAAGITPRDPEVLFLLGAVAFEMDPIDLGRERAKLARQAWRSYLEVAPEHPLASHVREALVHVDSLMEQGRFESE